MFSRTYPQATAGVPLVGADGFSLHFNRTNGDFEYCYTLNTSITEPTEIYANLPIHYPSGSVVTTSPQVKVTQQQGNIISVEAVAGTPTGSVACVNITRASAEAADRAGLPRDEVGVVRGVDPVGLGTSKALLYAAHKTE